MASKETEKPTTPEKQDKRAITSKANAQKAREAKLAQLAEQRTKLREIIMKKPEEDDSESESDESFDSESESYSSSSEEEVVQKKPRKQKDKPQPIVMAGPPIPPIPPAVPSHVTQPQSSNPDLDDIRKHLASLSKFMKKGKGKGKNPVINVVQAPPVIQQVPQPVAQPTQQDTLSKMHLLRF